MLVASLAAHSRALFLFVPQTQVQLLKLTLVYGGRRVHQQVLRVLVLGEGDHLADAALVSQEHDQAINAEGDTTVRGRAVLERFEHVAKLLSNLLIAEFHQ